MQFKRFSRRGVVLSAVLLATSVSWTGLGAPATASASGTVIVGGRVTDSGHGIANSEVAVFARPTSAALDRAGSAGVPLYLMALVNTDPLGSYKVPGNLATLPAEYRGNEGQVDLLIIADDGQRSVQWGHTVFPAAAGKAGIIRIARGNEQIQAGRFNDGSLGPATDIDLATGRAVEVGNPPEAWVGVRPSLSTGFSSRDVAHARVEAHSALIDWAKSGAAPGAAAVGIGSRPPAQHRDQ